MARRSRTLGASWCSQRTGSALASHPAQISRGAHHLFLPQAHPPASTACRWRLLDAAGYADTALTYVATNAESYKYFEHWAFGRGIALPHIINSGRSLGDNRCVVLEEQCGAGGWWYWLGRGE